MKKYLNVKKIIAAAVVFLISPFHIQAFDYSSLNFLINNPIVSEGGAATSGAANFVERGAIGGVRAVGKSSGTNFTVRSGFEYYDETAPDIKSTIVNDGLGADIEEQYSISSLSANWNGFADPESGLRIIMPYEYAVYRESDGKYWDSGAFGWQTAESWTATSLASATVLPVYLDTGDRYFFKVRAWNNIQMVSKPVLSNGVYVISKLSFSLSSGAVDLGALDGSNNFTSEYASSTTRVSTNARYGYTIKAWAAGNLANADFPQEAIADFAGTNELPFSWRTDCVESESYCAFGYTTSDNNLGGGVPDRFTAGGKKYARFSHAGPGDPVVDHIEQITGQTGEVEDEEFTIGYKVSANENTLTGKYATNIIFIAIPNF